MRLGANVIYVACFVFYYVHALVTLINDLLTYLLTYLVIIDPNSHEKLTKSEIMSSLRLFEHYSESLI